MIALSCYFKSKQQLNLYQYPTACMGKWCTDYRFSVSVLVCRRVVHPSPHVSLSFTHMYPVGLLENEVPAVPQNYHFPDEHVAFFLAMALVDYSASCMSNFYPQLSSTIIVSFSCVQIITCRNSFSVISHHFKLKTISPSHHHIPITSV